MALPLAIGPLYMLLTVTIITVLFWKKSILRRAAMIVLAVSVVIAGFLQWEFLDTTIYLHQVLYGIVNGDINPIQAFKLVLIGLLPDLGAALLRLHMPAGSSPRARL